MDKMRVRTYGDPVLKEKAAPVEKFDADLRALAQTMSETMYESKGIGLAAPQVGVSTRLVVVDVDWIRDDDDDAPPKRNLRAFVNPEIVSESDEDESMIEGCLSLPGVEGEVFRPVKVRVKYLDLDGAEHEDDMDGLLARCIQHEIDHLDGTLFVDRMPFMKRKTIAGALNKLKKETLALRDEESPSKA